MKHLISFYMLINGIIIRSSSKNLWLPVIMYIIICVILLRSSMNGKKYHIWKYTYHHSDYIWSYIAIAYRLFYTIQNVYNIHSHKRFSIWLQKKHTHSKKIPYTLSTRVNHILLLWIFQLEYTKEDRRYYFLVGWFSLRDL